MKQLLVFILLVSLSIVGYGKTYIKEHTYKANDYDSKVTSREKAIAEVQSVVLLELGGYIHSNTYYKQLEREGKLTETFEQEIKQYTTSILKTEILEERWDGEEYYIKAKVKVEDNDLSQQIREWSRQQDQKQEEIAVLEKEVVSLQAQLRRQKEIQTLEQEMDDLRAKIQRQKEAEVLEEELRELEKKLEARKTVPTTYSTPTKTKKKRYKTPSLEYAKDELRNFNVFSGVWIPNGELSLLGNKPEVGLTMGYIAYNWEFDFVMSFKFGQTSNEYEVGRYTTYNSIFYDDDTVTGDHFSAVYYGLEVGRSIWFTTRAKLELLAGVGFEDIVFKYEVEPDYNPEYNSPNTIKARATSTNLNLGLGYRYYVASSWYLGVQARYNIVYYQDIKGPDFVGRETEVITDLTGNAFTVRFVVGVVLNASTIL